MTEQEFIHKASHSGLGIEIPDAEKYAKKNHKDEYTDEDILALYYATPSLGVGGENSKFHSIYGGGKTTKTYTVYNSHGG